MLDWIRRSADRLAESPIAFHWLRKLPEWNFRETKRRIAGVRDALGRPRVLDCGCGTGEFAGLFPTELYLGVDLHPGYVAAARRLNPRHRFEVADLRSWSGSDARFELVLVNGVLHHLDDAAALELLGTARRQLAPGGTLLVIEDVHQDEASPITRLIHGLDHGDHIRDAGRWNELVSGVLPIVRAETYASGWCPYHLMLCRAG
jgi:trans-aconitate methyltransferase